MNKIFIYEEKFNELTTFNSYFYSPTVFGNKLIFPYFNVGVSNHALNPSNDIMHVDCSYLVIENAFKLLDISNYNSDSILFIGGVEIDNMTHIEMAYKYSKCYIAVYEDFKLKKFDPKDIQNSFWFPVDINGFIKNIDSNKIEYLKNINNNLFS